MTEICHVYWIHKKTHINPDIDGYVGITKNPLKRAREHRRASRMGSTYPVHSAIRKYGWTNLGMEVIFSGTLEECKAKEILLRPTEQIGWNICAGGVVPKQQSLEKQREHWERTLKGLKPTRHTAEFKVELTERNHRYLYDIWRKDGYSVKSVRLWEWCSENNIRQSCMHRVATGERSHHRGYHCLRVAIAK